tara:strand:+ start:197 stop:586 length:390 start_codon:yes stop_codon:yes gene_type:complete
MNRIFIDIDNKTPGALVSQILNYISKDGCMANAPKDLAALSTVNKYFNKIIRCPTIVVLQDRKCKIHHDYRLFLQIEAIIAHSKKNKDRWWHFPSLPMAEEAEEYVRVHGWYTGIRCCGGKGFKMMCSH